MTLPAAGETGLKERTWRGEAAFHSRIACSYRFVLLDFGSEESKGHSSAADQLAYITTTDFVAGMMQGFGCLELGLKLSAGSADGVSRT